MSDVKEQQFWDEMWDRKCKGREMFSHGILLVDIPAFQWNGNHPVESNTTSYIIPAGSKVLITMISRFGHVGIRNHDIGQESHGYDAAAQPEELRDLSFLSAG